MTQQPFLGSHRGMIKEMNRRHSTVAPHFQAECALHLSRKQVRKLLTLRLPGRYLGAAALTIFRIVRLIQKTQQERISQRTTYGKQVGRLEA